MKSHWITALALLGATALLGCEKKDAAPAPAKATSSQAASKAAPASEAPTSAAAPATKAGQVAVSATGTKFDPPVAKGKIPMGTWICDMGTVHYARAQKGDGVCPLCNMKLVQLATHTTKPHPNEAGHTHGADGHGHDHKHGHDHQH